MFEFKTKQYADFNDMKKYIDDMGSSYLHLDESGNKNQICFGISFDETSSRKWTYNFHYNVTGRPEKRDLYGFDDDDDPVRAFEYENEGAFKRQIRSGMFYLINYIDTEILRAETIGSAEINAKVVQAPVDGYKTSTVFNNLQGNMDTLLMFPIVLIFLRFVYLILYEKEHKIAQNLRNMGMSMYQFYFSWWLFYTILSFIYALVFTALTIRVIAPDCNFLLYFALFFFTAEVFLSIGIFISSFFSKAKPGVLCAIIAFFIMFGVSIAQGAISGANLNTNTWFALSPLSGLKNACNVILLVQSFYRSFGFDLVNKEINLFKYSIWFWMVFIQSILFYFLGIYLDQVWPKDTGVAKHPLYCFKKKKAAKQNLSKVVNF